MSYSFTVRAPNKAEARLAVASKFDEAIGHQVCHQRDKVQALSAAYAFIDLLSDDDSKDINVNMSGSLSGTWSGSDVTVISVANVSISAGHIARTQA